MRYFIRINNANHKIDEATRNSMFGGPGIGARAAETRPLTSSIGIAV
jgi:hypothetical protein